MNAKNLMNIVILLSTISVVCTAGLIEDFVTVNHNPSIEEVSTFVNANVADNELCDAICYEFKIREAEQTDHTIWNAAIEQVQELINAYQESKQAGNDQLWLSKLGTPFVYMSHFCGLEKGIGICLYATTGVVLKKSLIKVRVTICRNNEYDHEAWQEIQQLTSQFMNMCCSKKNNGRLAEYFTLFGGVVSLIYSCQPADQFVLCKIGKEKAAVDIRFYNQPDL